MIGHRHAIACDRPGCYGRTDWWESLLDAIEQAHRLGWWTWGYMGQSIHLCPKCKPLEAKEKP